MPTPITALSLIPGDVIRLSTGTRDLTVQTTTTHPDLDGVLTITFDDVATPVNFTTDCPVTAVHLPRTASVKCFLCPDRYPHEYDLAQGQCSPIGGLCGPCNKRTTIAALKSMGRIERT